MPEIDFANLSYAALIRVYHENNGMENAEQCRTLLRAIRSLRVVRPTETEKAGERISFQVLDRVEDDAKAQLASFNHYAAPIETVVPEDSLQ